jgi:hypothetical protein
MYLSNFAKGVPSCKDYDDLNVSNEKQVYNTAKKMLLAQKGSEYLDRNNVSEMHNFTQAVNLPMLLKNLELLDTSKKSKVHYDSTLARWTSLMQRL